MSRLHPDDERALEQIDAALFSGDGGSHEGLKVYREYVERWLRQIEELEEVFSETEEDSQ